MTYQQSSFAEYVRGKIIKLCILVLVECIVFTVIFAITSSNPMYVIELGEIQTIHSSFALGVVIAAAVGVIGMFILAKDLLEFIAASDEFVQLEKLATLGKFSAWAAHQIRNPLAVIRAQTQILSLKSQDESTTQACNLLMRQTDKMADLLSLMMTLSQPVLIHKEVVDLHTIWGEMLESFQLTYPQIQFAFSGNSESKVLGHPGLLEEAFKNLVTNAVENIDGEGTVAIACTKNPVAVQISILDSGPPISEQAAQSAFEIGFTNKRHGTGLGLPIVKTILTAHGGGVSISRAPGKSGESGTLVSLQIPTDDV